MNLHEAKENTIRELIERTLSGEDVSGRKELKYLSYLDISIFAKQRNFKYSIEDIGRDQKADLIKSIVKRSV